MKKRTRARELALQFLYMLDLRAGDFLHEAEEFVRGEEPDEQTADFALRLVRGTAGERDAIDDIIRSVAQNWDIERMAVIDRNVLRLATFELLHCDDIPPKVSINEAIELGKRYSTQNSGGFINGILDKIKDRFAGAPGDKGPAEKPEQPVTAPGGPEAEPHSSSDPAPSS